MSYNFSRAKIRFISYKITETMKTQWGVLQQEVAHLRADKDASH